MIRWLICFNGCYSDKTKSETVIAIMASTGRLCWMREKCGLL